MLLLEHKPVIECPVCTGYGNVKWTICHTFEEYRCPLCRGSRTIHLGVAFAALALGLSDYSEWLISNGWLPVIKTLLEQHAHHPTLY